MKPLHPSALSACLAALVMSAGAGVAIAADNAATMQELRSVLASSQVRFARWTTQADALVLQVGLGPPEVPVRSSPATTDPPPVAVAEALALLTPPPPAGPAALPPQERSSFFIGNTIANLRGLDPMFCGRTLTLIDGRRTLSGQSQSVRPPPPPPGSTFQPYAAVVKEPRLGVWLLKADSTQIMPVAYRCDPGPNSTARSDRVFEVSYAFPAAEGAQAVAVAIRVGNDYFIEKLQPLQPTVAVQ